MITLPPINAILAREVNSLSDKELQDAFAMRHELLWYGVDAIVHACLMHAAEMHAAQKTTDAFMDTYGIEFAKTSYGDYGVESGFLGVLAKLEEQGLFIPDYSKQQKFAGKVWYFSPDYGTRVLFHDAWPDKEYASLLLNYPWQEEDFRNKERLHEGKRFARDLWNTSIEGYHGGDVESSAEEIDHLGHALIRYYAGVLKTLS